MDGRIVLEKIDQIRRVRPLTNCYSMETAQKAERIWEKGESFVFSYEDHGIKRLTYFATSLDALDSLISEIDGGIFYLEFRTKDPNGYIPLGVHLEAKLMRLANPDCRRVFENDEVSQYRDDTIGTLASVEDAQEINTLLHAVFRTEISHLLTDEELSQEIRNGKITIHRGEHIDAVLQADVMPKKFYINQIVNKSSKGVIHAMLLSRLQTYVQNGGKYLYAWVEESNIASQKFHGKYGMTHDGMYNMVYQLER